MKVFANPKTLFREDPWIVRTYYKVRSWFKHSLSKNHRHLLAEVWRSRPWDICYLYDIEKAKIKEMADYLENSDMFVGVEYVVRDMRLCLSLIDIFTEKKDIFHFDGDIVFKKPEDTTEDSDVMELVPTPDFQYHCDVRVNTRNADRFLNPNLTEEQKEYWLEHPHEIYILKAKYLYHKIRNERDGEWWD